MGKKQKKPGKGKEKTERKTAKGEEKRARREAGKVGEEDDIDAILKSIQKEEAKKKEVHVDENVPAPSPRSNGSLTINPAKDTELILYGGEFYNGSKTFVYGDLYRYDVEKNEWKLVSSPNSPPPRSAHQTVAWKNNVYIFGGEFTSPNQECFHHYKDFWTLDLKTNQWEQILAKGCPSARSGHRMEALKWVSDLPVWTCLEGRDHVVHVHHPRSFKSVRRFLKKAIWLLPDNLDLSVIGQDDSCYCGTEIKEALYWKVLHKRSLKREGN